VTATADSRMGDVDRGRSLALRLGGLLVAIAIVFVFVVNIMVATAQQDVMSRMKTEQLSVGYNSALILERTAREDDRAANYWQHQQRTTTEQVRADQAALDGAQRQADLAWEEFGPTIAKISALGMCDLSIGTNADNRGRAVAATIIEQCAADDDLKPAALRVLKTAKDQAAQFLAAVQPFLQAQDKLNSDSSKLVGIKEQLALRTLTSDEQKAERSFSDMDVLLQPWMLGGQFLVQFPPALLQILLSFVSGLFGALLITMILIVYPNNLVTEKVDTHPGKRIAVGGMIALGVYIVLLSGTAILGSGTSSEGAGTNNMAITGIAVLAGMFSDKVAAWLSKQADNLFR
jgi:hypothetical protein